MSPFLDYLSGLPQFQASHLTETVMHIGTGCVLSKHKSDEPKHAATLSAHWPGQPRDELALFDGYKVIDYYSREAKSLGFPPEKLAMAMQSLESDLKA